MLVLICNYFDDIDRNGYPTGKKELVIDYAIDDKTMKIVPMPNVPPEYVGAKYNSLIDEWCIYSEGENKNGSR